MGLNVVVNLIIGIPLKELGEITDETEPIELFDAMGRETGKKVTLIRRYLETDQKRFLLATNEEDVLRGKQRLRLSLTFQDFPEDWIYYSDPGSDDLNQVLIGQCLEPISQGSNLDRYESYNGHTPEQILAEVQKVKERLKILFSYQGEVFIFTQASYSY